MESIKKLNCPHCGQEAECFFSGRKVDSVFLKDEYVARCPACGWQETKPQHAGHHIGNRDFPQGSICPFCGKPSDNHAKRLPLGEISRRFREREGMDGRLYTPPKGQKSPAAGSVSEPLPEIDVTLEPAVSRQRATLASPPRVKTEGRQRKTVTSRDIKNLMIFFTILYAITLGASSFLIEIWHGATIGAALQGALIVTAVTTVVMIFLSVLIVRNYRRRFENPLLKHQGGEQ